MSFSDEVWPRLREDIDLTWGSIFDDEEFESIDRDWDAVVSFIRDRTGESVEVVEAKLEHIVDPPTPEDTPVVA